MPAVANRNERLDWRAEAKDHAQSCESAITVSAIGIEAGPGSYFGSANDVSFSTPHYSASAEPRIAAIVVGQPCPLRAATFAKPKEYYYVTQRDDTLRALALRFYQNLDWRRILDANRAVVKDPNNISAGTRLVIPVN
jgi:nucleoid-associated protein YgaU